MRETAEIETDDAVEKFHNGVSRGNRQTVLNSRMELVSHNRALRTG
jgi:hypothetical protein